MNTLPTELVELIGEQLEDLNEIIKYCHVFNVRLRAAVSLYGRAECPIAITPISISALESLSAWNGGYDYIANYTATLHPHLRAIKFGPTGYECANGRIVAIRTPFPTCYLTEVDRFEFYHLPGMKYPHIGCIIAATELFIETDILSYSAILRGEKTQTATVILRRSSSHTLGELIKKLTGIRRLTIRCPDGELLATWFSPTLQYLCTNMIVLGKLPDGYRLECIPD